MVHEAEGRSVLIKSFENNGRVVKWPTTTDCKSVLLRVRWFESIRAHQFLNLIRDDVLHRRIRFFPGDLGPASLLAGICGSSSVGRATAFQAVGRGFEPRLPLKSHRLESNENGGDSTSRCSSGVEHFLGKEEVVSSILINGSC